ncbi:MAG: hypothetical protein M1820_008047 [Bogoriella megaspora]|nr:MAG: hypothetical protein M1820_008047 [Bogoriella megaspora]
MLWGILLVANLVALSCANAPLSLKTLSQPYGKRDYNTTSSDGATNATTPSTTCCEVVATGVALNEWWTSSYDITVATVITNYIQYNNTVLVGNVTTLHNPKASSVVLGSSGYYTTTDLYGLFINQAGGCQFCSPSLTGVPTTLAPNFAAQDYDATFILKGTEVVIDHTLTITSPTPFWQFESAGVFYGTPVQPTSGGPQTCSYPDPDETPLFEPDIGFYFSDPILYTDANLSHTEGILTFPTTLIDYIATIPSVSKQCSFMTKCIGGAGMGEPTVHIAVNELTDTQSATIKMAGNAPGVTPKPAPNPQSPSPPPMPKPTNQPAPVQSPEPANSATPDVKPSPANTPAPVTSQHQGAPEPSQISNGESSKLAGSGPSNSNGDSGSDSNSGSNGGSDSGSDSSPDSGSDSGSNSDSSRVNGNPEPNNSGPNGAGSDNIGGSRPSSVNSGSDHTGVSPNSQPLNPASPERGSQNGGVSGTGSSDSSGSDDSNSPTNGGSGDGELGDTGGLQGMVSAISEAAAQPGSPHQGSFAPAQTNPATESEPNSGSGPDDGSSPSIDFSGIFSAGASDAAADESYGSIGATVNIPVSGSSTINAVIGSSGAIILPGSRTINPGQAITYNGVPISVPTDEEGAPPSAIVVGSGTGASAIPLATSGPGSSPLQSVDIGGQAVHISYAQDGAELLLPSGRTLFPGQSTNINGVSVYLPSGENYLVEGSSTIAFASPTGAQSNTPNTIIAPVSFGPDEQGIVLGNGQTLRPGEETIISGTTVLLAPGETAIVVNGRTSALHPDASSAGVGNYVASGIGFQSTSTDAEGHTVSSQTVSGQTSAVTVQAAGSDSESMLNRRQSLSALTALVMLVIFVQ